MDKKKQLAFNLNNFLLSTSHLLDNIELQHNNTSQNHSKRVAFLSLKMGQRLGFNPEEMFDLCAYSLCHDIALNEQKIKNKDYYELSEEKIKDFPFLSKKSNILKYQGEKFDGSGIYELKENAIPLFSQILFFTQFIDEKYDFSNKSIENRNEIITFVKNNSNILFDEKIVNLFIEISSSIDFWIDIQNENDIVYFIFNNLHDFTTALDFEEVLNITQSFCNIVDNKSKIVKNSEKMCDFYEFDHKDKYIFMITASLCNIGKLLIPTSILEKDENLSINEYEEIKSYPYFNKKILTNIMGFNDIALCSSKVQECLDSSGYPFKLGAKDLSFKDRLLSTLNKYSSLCSNKNYRSIHTHNEAILILKDEANNKKLDISIIEDIDKIFLNI